MGPLRLGIEPQVPAAVARALTGFAILDASPSGVIGFATEKASTLLAKYFPCSLDQQLHRLPAVLVQWLKQQKSQTGSSSLVRMFQAGTEQLIVRVTGTEDGYYQLLLEERNDVTAAKRLELLGLTPRESEVLLWISRGKTNSEIATIVGCTLRTVTKHTEHIRSKLAVETRTAAAAIALEFTSRA
ncbi:response regulator transcription factor [Verrucomicrobiota bacterium sgz303538]